MKFAFAFSHFAVSIPNYFVEALRDEGHSVITIGAAHGNWLPYTKEGATKEGMNLPDKYIVKPDIELPLDSTVDWSYVESMLPYEVDAYLVHYVPPNPYGATIVGKPSGNKPMVMLGTDPHVLGDYYRLVADQFTHVLNMQHYYMGPDEYYVPYAYSPKRHFVQRPNRFVDVTCIGLQYQHRAQTKQWLIENNHRVLFQVGITGDEYRKAYNESKIAFSWSSHKDFIARNFEGPAMGAALVCNETPDLGLFFVDGLDCMTFTDYGGAIDACEVLLANPEALERIAANGLKRVAVHTYNNRVKWMVDILEHQLSPQQHNSLILEWLNSLLEKE